MHDPQTKKQRQLEHYKCKLYRNEDFESQSSKVFDTENPHMQWSGYTSYDAASSNKSISGREFNILRTGNCSGEYFGFGPTCRCQEAMRYFFYQNTADKWDWFIFIDDDIYMQPYAVSSLLKSLTDSSDPLDKYVALLSSSKKRRIDYVLDWRKKAVTSKSNKRAFHPKHPCHSIVYIAQPAIISRYHHL